MARCRFEEVGQIGRLRLAGLDSVRKGAKPDGACLFLGRAIREDIP